MASLQEQLQQTLGGTYTLERELGGGGMARVFVADETRLGRKVVVKVLSPELAAGISAERFEREIKLAASLQQANIVPVLSAGDTNGLPYFTMPFVEGESLRARLGKSPPLAITDIIRILGDVARALSYAHERGVVHRDIKPDNVLLSGGTAVVTDFGIAKAISASRTDSGGATLTQLGTSIGTPAYMAPEQAAGDPNVDHRADVYAFGCMAYELLAGRPPFSERTPQRVLVAHMSEAPRPVSTLRSDVPAPLAELVMRCLAKDADARPQTATEIMSALDGVTSAGPVRPPSSTGRALALYAVAFIAVGALANAAIVGIGLPDWVLPGALIVMALGLPVLLFTGYAQYLARHPSQSHGTAATMALKASPHLSWSRTTRWGTYALGGFTALVAATMLLRVAGIGPFATLLSAGTLKKNDKIVVAEFALANSSDTSLGRVISDAVKADLGQSNAVNVLPDDDVAATLARMQRRGARLLLPVAQEVALRRGVKAIVDGSLNPLGNGFVVKLRLVTADSARELASLTGAADSPSQLIDVVGKLTRKLRAKMGESLKSVQSSPELQQVTTTSLPALRKYSDGRYALDRVGDRVAFVRLMHEAIGLDSTFATAYATLAVNLNNAGSNAAEVARLIARAYELRDRLPDNERLLVEYHYFGRGPLAARDPVRGASKLDTLIARHLADQRGAAYIVTAGVVAASRGELARAESLYRAGALRDTTSYIALGDLIQAQMRQGKRAAAESTIRVYERRFPSLMGVMTNFSARFQADTGDLRGADARLRASIAAAGSDPYARDRPTLELAGLAGQRGMLREQALWLDRRTAALRDRGVTNGALQQAATIAQSRIEALGDTAGAVRLLDAAVVASPVEAMDLLDRPYYELAQAYAMAGRVDRAKLFLAGARQQGSENDWESGSSISVPRAEIAMAEGRWDEAIGILRITMPGRLPGRGAPPIDRLRAIAFDGKGQSDSAIVWYERFAGRIGDLGVSTVVTHRRLGELYEAKGDLAKAISHYRKFADTWKEADAELLPQVADVKRRIARLEQLERRAR
jgi:tRNA A-37 threonylcarbamoyl transferase component Bud32/tetratricopeptide (TPR) repeat protein